MNFNSNNTYIYLPSKKNFKVALAIDNITLSRNSFKLYNPFSVKAKFLKFLFKNLSIYCNGLIIFFFAEKVNSNSDFIIYLEEKIGQKLNVSIYFSTVKDKVVLQLQSKDSIIIGYLKIAANNIGNEHLNNEINAATFLGSKGLIASNYLIFHGAYKGMTYCLLKDLKGEIGFVPDGNINAIIRSLNTPVSYTLLAHPRILDIEKKLELSGFKDLVILLNKSIGNINKSFKVVYEHGDFVDWNILKLEDSSYSFFDFEYFEKNGLEYMDLFKLNYQRATLLKKKSHIELIDYMQSKIPLELFRVLFIIYLLKEITIKYSENLNFDNEKELLNLLN